jgi:hypothetical protein
MSIIFRDGKLVNDQCKGSSLVLLNRSRGKVVDPLEELDEEEKIAVLSDILASEAFKNDVKVKDPEWQIATTIFGNPKKSKINGKNCIEIKLKISSDSEKVFKGMKDFTYTKKQYFDKNFNNEEEEISPDKVK